MYEVVPDFFSCSEEFFCQRLVENVLFILITLLILESFH
jgi:hypothetical protein